MPIANSLSMDVIRSLSSMDTAVSYWAARHSTPRSRYSLDPFSTGSSANTACPRSFVPTTAPPLRPPLPSPVFRGCRSGGSDWASSQSSSNLPGPSRMDDTNACTAPSNRRPPFPPPTHDTHSNTASPASATNTTTKGRTKPWTRVHQRKSTSAPRGLYPKSCHRYTIPNTGKCDSSATTGAYDGRSIECLSALH